PGLHSLFAAFDLAFVEGDEGQTGVDFRVVRTDPRFRLVQMNVSGGGVRGSVDAFLRWPPIEQAPLAEIRKRVAPGEFANSRALIVGGSRGLGALTAKAIAAGSGAVVITYATGEVDAMQVKDEINREIGPATCRTLRYDARKSAADQLGALTEEISHLYYF